MKLSWFTHLHVILIKAFWLVPHATYYMTFEDLEYSAYRVYRIEFYDYLYSAFLDRIHLHSLLLNGNGWSYEFGTKWGWVTDVFLCSVSHSAFKAFARASRAYVWLLYTSSSSSLARVSSSLSLHRTCSALYAFCKFSSSLISARRCSRCTARRFRSSFMGSGFMSLKAMLVSFLWKRKMRYIDIIRKLYSNELADMFISCRNMWFGKTLPKQAFLCVFFKTMPSMQ